MKTIQAKVNTRLLRKASRLFTGSLSGRIIEVLQNARRAGATEVEITNKDCVVTVRDNGRGIENFDTLLDLGGSGWADELEGSEDPAGVGLFCLSPRIVTIRSNGQRVTLEPAMWTGAPADVHNDPRIGSGTMLKFEDTPWTRDDVQPHAVFCGMQVTVDGQVCARESFISDSAQKYPELGCHIEVRDEKQLSTWHRSARNERVYSANVIVNFHGQLVCMTQHPVSARGVCYLVELSVAPTSIRLMLPARTQLVENEAFQKLMAALELEAYRFIQRKGKHKLPFTEYLRAKDLGIQLPEATPTFAVGLIGTDIGPEPVEVSMPEGHSLNQCYRMSPELMKREDLVDTNAHLLAALGSFETPFVPVSILRHYDGFSWADLPTIDRIEVEVGKEQLRQYVWGNELSCVDELQITAHTSDGRVFSSPVCMAVEMLPPAEGRNWGDELVRVTPTAQYHLRPYELMYHLGGFSDEGDTYDTQETQFERESARFWADLVGPEEHLRHRFMELMLDVPGDWREVTVYRAGVVNIRLADCTNKTLVPPTDK